MIVEILPQTFVCMCLKKEVKSTSQLIMTDQLSFQSSRALRPDLSENPAML